jgi:L-malate glycosyltransferase
MNILIYHTSSFKAVSIESIGKAFREQGHRVFLLTYQPYNDLHKDMAKYGIEGFAYTIPKKFSPLYYLKHLIYLLQFIRKHKIDIVYSHLSANVAALVAQYFTKVPIYLYRHHADWIMIQQMKNAMRTDLLINKYAKHQVVVSKRAYDHILKKESGNPSRLQIIPLAYDFDLFYKPEPEAISELKRKHSSKLTLLVVGRHIRIKRHIVVFQIVKELLEEGYDVSLMVMDTGPEEANLKKFIADNQLEEKIIMYGFQKNIFNYLQATDILIHLSESESSSGIIKEAAVAEKLVIACKDVGDTEEYAQNGINCFLVNKEEPLEETKTLIKKIYNNRENYSSIGAELKKVITERFHVKNILPVYDKIHESLKK